MNTLSRYFSSFGVLFLLLVVGLLTTVPASAQQAGVSITPATIEETLDPGAQKDYTVRIQNLNSVDETFYVSTRNISSVRPGGVPVFAQNNLERTGFELADWITLATTEVFLPANGTANIDFTMQVPEDASCSHFGGVFVSAEPPEIESSGAAVGYQVANLLSIRVNGDCVEAANIREFSTDKFLYGAQDVNFTVRIENTGDVLVRPVGPLEVYNMLGSKVGNVTFNEERAAVFPGIEREYESINWVGDSLGFGRYEAIVSPQFGADGAKQTISSTVTFWIIPFNIILPIIGVLAVILLLTYFIARSYIRRSLAVHTGQGRRLVKRRRKGGSSGTLLLVVVMLTVIALFLIVLLALFA